MKLYKVPGSDVIYTEPQWKLKDGKAITGVTIGGVRQQLVFEDKANDIIKYTHESAATGFEITESKSFPKGITLNRLLFKGVNKFEKELTVVISNVKSISITFRITTDSDSSVIYIYTITDYDGKTTEGTETFEDILVPGITYLATAYTIDL